MVKNILFRFKLKGKGIVNYDNSDQSYTHEAYKTVFKGNRNSNVNYSKKHFYKDEEGKVLWKIIVSSNCLRHNIFIKDAFSQSPAILKDDIILYNYLSSPANIMRGYVFVNVRGSTVKRKSAIMISDAEQICNSISTIEQFAKTGIKGSGKIDSGGDKIKSDTFYSKETIGDIEYCGNGIIDLMQLQFTSCSQDFDRFEFNPDNIELYRTILNTYLQKAGIEDALEIKNYLIANSTVLLSEEGILFSNDIVNYFVREFFERMLKLNIRKNNAYAILSELEYKLVEDVIVDTFNSDDNWVSLNNMGDIKNISFEMEKFYIESSDEDVIRTKEAIDKFTMDDTQARIVKDNKKTKIVKTSTPTE